MTRDMTAKQFRAAAKRNGFGPIVLGWIEDPQTACSFGMVYEERRGKFRLNRRATLAKILRDRERQEGSTDGP